MKNRGKTISIYLTDEDLKKLESLKEWYIFNNSELIKFLISQEYSYIRVLKEEAKNIR